MSNHESSEGEDQEEYEKEWRPVKWSEENKEALLKKVTEFQLGTNDVSEGIRILLHGPIGTGKSSFINSVYTALQGQHTVCALTDSLSGQSQSFTLKIKSYRMKKAGPGSYYPFVFTDIMGLEPDSDHGIPLKDIENILKGHVKEGYPFNPLKPFNRNDDVKFYRTNPSLKDRVHCLVSVLPADKMSLISDEVIHKMRAVRKKARDLEIPQVVVMSMVDKACPLVEENLCKIYTSKKIKKKMKQCSDKLGVPMNCIYPVLNYHEKVTNDLGMDILILMAVSDIIRFSSDYVEEQNYNAIQDAE